MITEGYFGNMKNYPETDKLVCISFKYPWFVKRGLMEHSKVLAPHPDILEQYKHDEITWEQYEERYRFDMTHYTKPLGEMRYWRNFAENQVVRFMCWEKNHPCHRFILLDIIHSSSGSAKK